MAEQVLDRAAIMERVAGDQELLGEIIDIFLEDCPRLMDEVRDAVSHQDGPRLREAAHALKGSVGNFAASAAYEAALLLERIGSAADFSDAARANAALEEEIKRVQQKLAELTEQP